MKLQKNGKWLFLALAISNFSGCKETIPPKIPVYIGDGVGGADGVKIDGTYDYKLPSELKGYWMTDQASMAQFSAWCYGIQPEEARSYILQIRQEMNDQRDNQK